MKITVAQAANRLGVSHMTVRRHIEAGRIPAYRFGRLFRIDEAELDRFIEASKVVR